MHDNLSGLTSDSVSDPTEIELEMALPTMRS